jgi:hypothetical protein
MVMTIILIVILTSTIVKHFPELWVYFLGHLVTAVFLIYRFMTAIKNVYMWGDCDGRSGFGPEQYYLLPSIILNSVTGVALEE